MFKVTLKNPVKSYRDALDGILASKADVERAAFELVVSVVGEHYLPLSFDLNPLTVGTKTVVGKNGKPVTRRKTVDDLFVDAGCFDPAPAGTAPVPWNIPNRQAYLRLGHDINRQFWPVDGAPTGIGVQENANKVLIGLVALGKGNKSISVQEMYAEIMGVMAAPRAAANTGGKAPQELSEETLALLARDRDGAETGLAGVLASIEAGNGSGKSRAMEIAIANAAWSQDPQGCKALAGAKKVAAAKAATKENDTLLASSNEELIEFVRGLIPLELLSKDPGACSRVELETLVNSLEALAVPRRERLEEMAAAERDELLKSRAAFDALCAVCDLEAAATKAAVLGFQSRKLNGESAATVAAVAGYVFATDPSIIEFVLSNVS